jgi:hypothetical protein
MKGFTNAKGKPVGIFLAIIAVLFYFQWLSQDVPAIVSNATPLDITQIGIPTNPVHVLDLGFFLPAMIATAALLWKKNAMGYFFAGPLLIFSALTGAGIILANNLMRTNGIVVSYIPDVIVGIVVVASVMLSWLYLKNLTDTQIIIGKDKSDRISDRLLA